MNGGCGEEVKQKITSIQETFKNNDKSLAIRICKLGRDQWKLI